jgi:CRP-like cAMP-binding protein
MAVSSEVLRSQRAFSHLSETDIAALASCLQSRRVARGDLVFRQGDAGDTLMVVDQGHLTVLVRDAEGKQRAVAEVSAGALLGEMACLDPSPRSATVLARTDASVLVLSRDALQALRAYAPGSAAVVYDVVLRAVLARLGEVNAQMIERVGPASRPVSGVAPRASAAPPSSVAAQVRGWFRRSAS